MKSMFKRAVALALGATLSWATPAQDAFPNKTVRILVPFAAGGGADVYARVLAQALHELWQQPVVVENRLGAAGAIALQAMRAAAHDGHTLTIVSSSFAINPLINSSLPFDTNRDFVPITEIAMTSNVLVVPTASPYQSARELIEDVRKRPGQLSYGMAGNATSAHLAGELLKHIGRLDIAAVGYKGGAPFLNDLMAGHVPMGFSNVPEVSPLVKSGRVRALAVTTLERSPVMPEVPTLVESGVTGYDASVWWGIIAPAGVPEPILRKLNTDFVRALRMPEVKSRIEAGGAVVVGSSSEQFRQRVIAEQQLWAPVIKAAGIKSE